MRIHSLEGIHFITLKKGCETMCTVIIETDSTAPVRYLTNSNSLNLLNLFLTALAPIY